MKLGLYSAKKAFIATIIVFIFLNISVYIKHHDSALTQPSKDGGISQTYVTKHPSRHVEDTRPDVMDDSHMSASQAEYCNKHGVREIKPELFKKILVNDKYKILYCSVPKVACTNWGRMFLILSGKMNTTNPMDITSGDVHVKYKKYLTSLSEFPEDEIKYRLDNYYKFVFTREPLERVLSAYLNKLKAKNPYFHRRFGKKIVERFRIHPGNSRGHDVTFREFVQYLTDFTRKEPANEHWQRIADICHPCLVKYDFIGSMNNMNVEADNVLKHIGASQILKFPRRSSLYKTPRTKSLMRKFYSRLPPAMLDQLLGEYYPDFLMFNLTIPKELQDLTRWIQKY